MVFTRDAEGRLVPLGVTPAVQPVQQGISSSSGMAQVSSAENPVDTSVPPGGQVNLKSSSMSPQQQQTPPVQKTPLLQRRRQSVLRCRSRRNSR